MDYQSIISDKPISRDYGQDVDAFIRVRDTAKMDLVKSRMFLLNAGVKTVKEGQLNYLPGLDVNKFIECANQEFYWEAEMKDGRIIKQFEGKRQNHYNNIDQAQLKIFRWVSNFLYETSNLEKRVIVSLNFETGIFDFINGFVPQEIRAAVINGFIKLDFKTNPKLIMKLIRRTSTSLSYPDGAVDEVCYYTRYLIGWEFNGEKQILCIEPNGFVHLWTE
jgi:hypothetical protein